MRRLLLALLGLPLLLGVGFLALPSGGETSADSDLPPRPAPWMLASTSDGALVYAACSAGGFVAVVDVSERRVVATIELQGTPRGLALSPDDRLLAVTLEREDEVLLLDRRRRTITKRWTTGTSPQGVAFSADGRRLFVANRLSGDVSVIEVEHGTEIARLEAGEEPFALARSPDGKTVAVVSRRATIAAPDLMPQSEVTLIDAEEARVEARVMLPSCHLSESAAFTPDSAHLLVPAVRVRNLLPIVQVARGWVLSGVLAVVDVEQASVAVLPMQFVNQGFADPTGVAVSSDATRAYVASGGVDEVAVLDLPALLHTAADLAPDAPESFALTRRYVLDRVSVGDNPRGLAWLGRGPQGDLVVADRLDDDLTVLDKGGGLVGRVPIGSRRDEDELHRGERAFFDATYCFQNAFSCTSCHPEGHTDGLTYDFQIDGVGRNILLNRSLLGLRGTEPFKWIGINPSLQRQCGARFAMVLTRADPFPLETLDAMAAWLLSRPAPRSPTNPAKADEATRASIERGRGLFERSRWKDGRRLRPSQRCVTCHPPPLYTNRQRTDVGTRGPQDDHGAFDVPHLTATATKAPYLHDGRALTLEDVLQGLGDRHGAVSDLGAEDWADLVAFLNTL